MAEDLLHNMNYYRVVTGFKSMDFISIDQTEVEKALKAQVTGAVVLLKGGSIAGNNIQRIVPDYQRVMGYNKDYQLSSEDFEYIPKQVVVEHENFYANMSQRTEALLQGKATPPLIEISQRGEGIKSIGEALKNF